MSEDYTDRERWPDETLLDCHRHTAIGQALTRSNKQTIEAIAAMRDEILRRMGNVKQTYDAGYRDGYVAATNIRAKWDSMEFVDS